jgi:hypothetical protein
VSSGQQQAGSEQARPVSEWLEGLGKLRDGLLVFGGATYVLGYLVWSIHAKQENLGLLPGLEPQYLAAGLVPLLLVLLAIYGSRGAKRLPEVAARWRDGKTGIWPTVLRGVGIACLAGGYAVLSWQERSGKQSSLTHVQVFFTSIAMAVLFLSGLILWLDPSEEPKPPGKSAPSTKPEKPKGSLEWFFSRWFVRFFMFC